MLPGTAVAQGCDPATPTFTVNLTGRPDSVWTSTAVERDGNCCGTTAPDKCIEFILTLDSGSNGIRLDIPTGALPGGALFYQISCGTSYQVGQDICLNGPGPHRITFCKPGNNINTYQITAIPKPDLKGNLVINEACVGHLKAYGLVTSSITWESVPNNATHNAYLSCLSACDSVSIIPSGNYPPTVTYRVCGAIAGGCGGATFCDTATVRFVSNIDVDIQPKNATVCFGGSTARLTANPIGGLPPYHFLWSTNDTAASINVSAGTYFVQMLDSLGCTIARDTVVVTSFASAIDANAGNDTALCINTAQALLNGTLQGGVGGIWKGGTGTYTPNDTTVNATYRPSAAEISAGTVTLRLVTTRNGTCPADSDEVTIAINPNPVVTLSGPVNVCAGRTASYSTKANPGNTCQWNVTGGTVTSTVADTLINIVWGVAGTGNVSVRQANSSGCDSIRTLSITINPIPAVTLAGPVNVCTGRSSSYSTKANTGNTYLWTVTGGTITSTIADTLIHVLWGATGTGSVSIKQTSTANCDSASTLSITINPIPVVTLAGPVNVCTGRSSSYSTKANAGNTYQWSVTGGTITSTVADTLINVVWGTTGTGSVSIKQTSTVGCDSLRTLNTTINPIPAVTLAGPVNVCMGRSSSYSTKANAGNTYLWTVSGGTITSTIADTLIHVIWGATGTRSVSIKQTSTAGCDSLRTLNITINPIPVVTLAGPVNVCTGRSSSYSTKANAGNTYQWSVTGGTITSTIADTLIHVLWGATGTGTVSIKQTSTVSCDSVNTLNITINPIPVVTLTGPVNVCTGKTTSYSTKANAGNTYQWSVTGGTITSTIADTLIHVLWGAAGSGSVSIKQTNTTGCDSVKTLNIIINPTPAVILNGPVSVCTGKTTSYYTNSNTGNTYQWIIAGGTITSTVADTFILVMWDTAGTGSVSIKQTSSVGCDSVITLNIIINATPAVTINGPANACAGKAATYYTNANPGNTYQWNITGGSITSTIADTLVNVIWGTTGGGSVSIKQTSSAGCDFTRTLTFTINPTPVVTLSGPVNACTSKTTSYSTNANAGNTYLWNVTGGTIVTTVADTFITVLWGASGTGSVSIKQTNSSGCDSVRILNITINPTPAVTLSGPVNACAGKTTSYSTNANAGNTYQWNVTGGVIATTVSDTLINVLWGPAGTGSINIKQTSALGCDSTRALSITINPTPAVTLTGPVNVCASKTSTYSTKANTGSTYQWSVTGGTITSTVADTLIYVRWAAAGNGSVSIRQTNTQGCDSVRMLNISINPSPVVAVTGSTGTCAGTTYTYSLVKQTGVTYTWSVTKGAIVQNHDSLIVVRWDSTGSGTVHAQGVNVFNCDSSFTLPVTITAPPVAVIAGGNNVCAYSLATYQASGTNIARYKWTVSNGTITGADTNASVVIKWGNQAAGTVTIRVISPSGCDSTTSFAVGIRPTPLPLILGPDSVCAFTQSQYSTSYTAGNTYAWQANGGSLVQVNDTTVLVSWHSSANASVSVKVTNLLLCDSTATLPVRLFNRPRPVIAGPLVLCEKKTGLYTVTKASQMVTTTWIVPSGSVQAVNDTQANITWLNAGLHRISVKQVNSKGCDTTVFVDVRVNARPYEPILGDNDVCRYAEKSWWVNHTAGYAYSWTVAGGTITGSKTDSLVRVKWDTTTGMLQLRLVNANGCDTSLHKIINIKTAPSGQINGDTIACTNVLKYSYSINDHPDMNYLWRADTGEIIGAATNHDVDVSWKKPGLQTIKLYVINTSTGCDSNFYRNVTVDSIIKPELSLSKSGGCIPFTLIFEPTNLTTTDYNYSWNFGNGSTSKKRKEQVNYNTEGVYTTKLVVTNKNGCRDSATTTIVANARPVARPDYERVQGRIYVIEDTIQFINRSDGGNLFIWKIISVKTDTAFETRSSFEHPGYHTVWLTAIDTVTGCLDSAEIELRTWVRENVYVPTAFSPNEDGNNDFFSIGFENVVEFEVLIVNRWGEIIYRSNDPDFKWDGTFKNQKCQDDAYVYLVNARGYHGKPFSMKGTVTLLR